MTERVGAYASVDGSLRLVYTPCDGEVLESVTLYELDGDPVAPESGDVPLWSVPTGLLNPTASRSPTLEWQVPNERVVANGNDRLSVYVISTLGQGGSQPFTMDEARQSSDDGSLRVQSGGGSFDDYVSRAIRSC